MNVVCTSTRLVKTVSGKPVNRFPTGSWFPERITAEPVIEFIARHVDTTQAMATSTHCAAVTAVASHFSRNSSVVGNFCFGDW